MAADLKNKAISIAQETVQAAEQFAAALDKLQALEKERVKSGINLSLFDADFAVTGSVAHVTGADLIALLATSMTAILGFLDTDASGGHWTNINKVRP